MLLVGFQHFQELYSRFSFCNSCKKLVWLSQFFRIAIFNYLYHVCCVCHHLATISLLCHPHIPIPELTGSINYVKRAYVPTTKSGPLTPFPTIKWVVGTKFISTNTREYNTFSSCVIVAYQHAHHVRLLYWAIFSILL